MEKYFNLSKPILITGESGTGKSQLARKIFENSSIYKQKFLVLHMASIKEDLLESELYGHKKGSFTGAIENKNGYFKDAVNGTLFLDEIGELSLEAQKKLLYSLEEKKYSAVGDTEAQQLNCRIIMATNKDLKKLVQENKFREDLYFRISNFQIEAQPLRFKKDQIENVIQSIFESIKSEYEKKFLILSNELLDYLINYSWPGNYRELKNVLENLVVFSNRRILSIEDLPVSFKPKIDERKPVTNDFYLMDYGESLEAFEAAYLSNMLLRYDGKINETARKIGISKSALIYKAKKYRINTLKMRADIRGAEMDSAA